jgi:hypothetical protein
MSLQQYQENHLLFNINFLEASSSDGLFGFRGELVLVEGEVADAKGHTKPPEEVMRGAAILADEKLKMIIGAIDRLEAFDTFLQKYQADFASDMVALIYVVNLDSPVTVEVEGVNFILIPLTQGVPWNEVIDELGLEKSDFKGQSAADKIVTLCGELKGYKPKKYPQVELDQLFTMTNDEVREGWGAI